MGAKNLSRTREAPEPRTLFIPSVLFSLFEPADPNRGL
jgi:hypothetical protein